MVGPHPGEARRPGHGSVEQQRGLAVLDQPMPDRLGRRLLVTLEAAHVNAELPVLAVLRSWLDSWRGIGAIERGMARQGFDLQLTRYDEKGWRATFYTTGMEHSITSATASAWERTPWHATHPAAWGGAEEGQVLTVRSSSLSGTVWSRRTGTPGATFPVSACQRRSGTY